MPFIRPIIKGGGTDVSDTTAVASDVLAGEDFYLASGTKTTGTIETYAGSVNVTENATLETGGTYVADDIVVNVSGGGEVGSAKELIEGTITEYIDTEGVSNIYDYAFYSRQLLTTVSFPSCSYIGMYAFQSCSALTTVSFPNCTNVAFYAFNKCSSLTIADFPSCKEQGAGAFQSCIALTTANFPEVMNMGIGAFNSCSSLTTVNFPKGYYIAQSIFQGCIALTTVNFPEGVVVGSSAFYYCYSLSNISFPKCTHIYNSAFNRCSSLTIADFPKCTTIGSSAFYSCHSLSALILAGSSVASLGINVFTSTPMSLSSYLGYFGSIYVPASLVDTYKTRTNWSAYSDRITSIIE